MKGRGRDSIMDEMPKDHEIHPEWHPQKNPNCTEAFFSVKCLTEGE
jgi:hypothetical protein